MNQDRNGKEEQSLLGPGKPQWTITSQKDRNDGEAAPFIADPVRLTPAWEASNLPNDELNFKGMTMERAQLETQQPRDRYNLVYLTLLLHGVGTLMPWNMFITAKSYFVPYKLAIDSVYASNFLAYLTFAAQVPNVLFNWLNIYVQIGGDLTTRIVWSISIEILVFLVTVGLAMSPSQDWQEIFFWVTMTSVVILNMANGIYQNTVYGMAAKLPPKYTGAVVLGSNISGTFTVIISMLSEFVFSKPSTAAIYYFITAMFVLLACFDTYFALPLNRFYRYHEMKNEQESQMQSTEREKHGTPYYKIFKQAFPQLFNVFLVFFVTLSIFPNVHSDIKANDPEFFIPKNLYTVVTCFLTFNVFAMLGSSLSSFVAWPKPQHLSYIVILRILFIPFFLLCKYQPLNIDRTLSVVVTNDWVYWLAAVLMSLSSGYLSSLGMMYTPRTVEPKYAVTAGMFAAAALITGIFGGICFSLSFPSLVSSIPW